VRGDQAGDADRRADASLSVERLPSVPLCLVTVTLASTPADISEVRGLFLEYGASLGFSLCSQGFYEELAGLPGA
jgi:hypothetical protein